jgi:hypothetical protein
MHYRRLIALLIVCTYLILPLDCLANFETSFANPRPSDTSATSGSSLAAPRGASGSHAEGASFTPSVQSAQGDASLQLITHLGVPASHCPCTDRHGSEGCDFGCSCCSCCSYVAPLASGIVCRAPQPAISFSMIEPLQYFPKVYLPIFVPPQNRS